MKKMATVTTTGLLLIGFVLNLTLAAVTKVTLCNSTKSISARQVSAAIINKTPRQSSPGRSIAECLQQCAQDVHCFTSAFNPKNNTCDSYTETIPLLPYVAYTDVGINGKYLASSFDNQLSTLSYFNCSNFCKSGERCRMDCGFGTGALAEPICIADHTDCTSKLYNNLMYARFFGIEAYGTSVVGKTVTYTKLNSNSTLRLSWRGDMRTPGGCTDCCIRYSLKLNGSDCANPGPLDSLQYQANYATNTHRSDGIEGLCYGLPAGLATITMEISPCPSGPGSTGQGYFGHQSASWIYVQELDLPIDPVACPGMLPLNIKQFQTSTYMESATPVEHQYAAMSFTKVLKSTALKIIFNGGYRLWPVSQRCARWYYKFNGSECTSPGRAEMAVSQHGGTEGGGMRLRYGLFEVICFNIPDGIVNITLNIGACPANTGWFATAVSTGWPAGTHYSRFIVEEVQMASDFTAALTITDGKTTMDRLPYYNLYHAFTLYNNWGCTCAANNIKTLVLPKRSARTAVRVSFNSGGRALTGTYYCVRYFMTFNGTECASPGNIDGIIEDSTANNNDIRQFTVDGICTGLAAGNVTIALNAMKCPHVSGQADGFIGWQTTSYFYAYELAV